MRIVSIFPILLSMARTVNASFALSWAIARTRLGDCPRQAIFSRLESILCLGRPVKRRLAGAVDTAVRRGYSFDTEGGGD